MVSEFDGGVLEHIVTCIYVAFITLFTLGIGTPWAVCHYKKWETSHTIIDGRRLTFTGSGGELFAQYIKWFILTIITLGIYGFWLTIKLKQWMVSRTHVEM